jgi:hypothetical protein
VYVFCASFLAILPQSERAARAEANYDGADAESAGHPVVLPGQMSVVAIYRQLRIARALVCAVKRHWHPHLGVAHSGIVSPTGIFATIGSLLKASPSQNVFKKVNLQIVGCVACRKQHRPRSRKSI